MGMRKKEPWMVKGNAMQLSTGLGVLVGMVESNIGGVLHVMNMRVRPAGVLHAWNYNPNDVELANVKWCPGIEKISVEQKINQFEQLIVLPAALQMAS